MSSNKGLNGYGRNKSCRTAFGCDTGQPRTRPNSPGFYTNSAGDWKSAWTGACTCYSALHAEISESDLASYCNSFTYGASWRRRGFNICLICASCPK